MWVSVKVEMPDIAGKYVIRSTTRMGNINRFEARLYITGDKRTWDVSNQIVTHWLKEA